MMASSKIEWTDATWNPVTGCTKVSAGCANCYAERLAPRVFAGQSVRIQDMLMRCVGGRRSDEVEIIQSRSRPRRFTDVRTHPDRLNAPLRWSKPKRVFVNSMSDLFHEDVPDEFIDRVFAVMQAADRHTFQVLTKRERRMKEWFDGGARRRVTCGQWPLPNVWLGVSCENQRAADERIPLLLDTPASVRWVSAEPLLGPIDFGVLSTGQLMTIDTLAGEKSFIGLGGRPGSTLHCRSIDWVVVGGESGPKARPCDVAWIRNIVQQCKDAGVPCFVKQLGAMPMQKTPVSDRNSAKLSPLQSAFHAAHDGWPIDLRDRKGGDPSEWPDDLRVREFPGGA